jgi:hypothetical protein
MNNFVLLKAIDIILCKVREDAHERYTGAASTHPLTPAPGRPRRSGVKMGDAAPAPADGAEASAMVLQRRYEGLVAKDEMSVTAVGSRGLGSR